MVASACYQWVFRLVPVHREQIQARLRHVSTDEHCPICRSDGERPLSSGPSDELSGTTHPWHTWGGPVVGH